MVAPSSLPTSWPRSVLAAGAAGFAAAAAGWVAAAAGGAVAGWVGAAAGLAAGAAVVGAAAGACVGAAGADAVHAARTDTTPAPNPVVSSVRRVIIVPRACACFENIPILLLSCPHSCRAELTRPVVEVHGCDGSERNGLVRFLPILARPFGGGPPRTQSAGGTTPPSAGRPQSRPRPRGPRAGRPPGRTPRPRHSPAVVRGS